MINGILLVIVASLTAYDWFFQDGKWRLTPLLMGFATGTGLSMIFTNP